MSRIKKLIVIFVVAFLLRIILIPVAHHGDLNNNISWGNEAIARGLVNYYEGANWPYSAPNQPPLYILLFALTSFVWKFLHEAFWSFNNSIAAFPSGIIWFWEQKGMLYLVKLPGIFADLGIAYLLYKYFRNNKRLSLLIPTIWLFNPVTWYNSAIWGQTDAVVNLLGLFAIFALLKKDIVKFAAFFAVAFLFKGSLGIFIPIILVVLLWQKHTLDKWLKAAAAAFAVVITTSIWFHPSIDLPIWLANLYQTRILEGEIGDLTANAFNFWWLVDPGKTLDSTMFLGFPARIWGYMMSLTGIGAILFLLRKKLSEKNILLALALTALVTFLFMTRIHERYLYPFFPVATLLMGLIPSLLIPYLLLSVVHLLNLYHLFWAPSIPSLEMLYDNPIFMQSLSIITVVIFVFYFFKFAKQKL